MFEHDFHDCMTCHADRLGTAFQVSLDPHHNAAEVSAPIADGLSVSTFNPYVWGVSVNGDRLAIHILVDASLPSEDWIFQARGRIHSVLSDSVTAAASFDNASIL